MWKILNGRELGVKESKIWLIGDSEPVNNADKLKFQFDLKHPTVQSFWQVSGAATSAENEIDLSKVEMSLEHYECFTKVFMETAGDSLNETEIEYLPLSAILMTLECGMSFLEDYLNGDVYFKVDLSKPKHNLDRARNQFKMVIDMEGKLESMKAITSKYCFEIA